MEFALGSAVEVLYIVPEAAFAFEAIPGGVVRVILDETERIVFPLKLLWPQLSCRTLPPTLRYCPGR